MNSVTPSSPSWRNDLPWIDPDEADLDYLEPGARAVCINCTGLLIAKCGEINRWHWAHEGKAICTGEGEGAWHLAWKHWAHMHGARVELESHPHRADIVWPDGNVYECQTNYTDADTIRRRENHYGDKLTWIYRWLPGRWDRLWNVGDGWFRWARPAPSMTLHEAPIIWHHLDRLYDVTVKVVNGDEIHVRFARGEDDKYGPVLYGSRPAPFHVGEAVTALNDYMRGAA